MLKSNQYGKLNEIMNMNEDEEIWEDIPEYEGMYQVSNMGRVKSLERISSDGRRLEEKIRKVSICRSGYEKVNLSKDGNLKTIQIHKMVAICFLDHIPDGHTIVVDHIDENKLNNRLDNLQLVSNRENVSKYNRSVKTSSQYTGVSWDKRDNKWRSQISIDGNRKNLGNFDCEIEAHEAYKKKLNEINP